LGACHFWEKLIFSYYVPETSRKSYVSEKLLSGCSVYPPPSTETNVKKRPKNKEKPQKYTKQEKFA
jgi:hypothetical protein